jgi:hypothetical protein
MAQDAEKKPDSTGTTGEWRARTGVHRPLDTGVLRALDGAAADDPKPSAGEDDPYNRTMPPLLDPTVKQKRRSLDDMRRLSEEIKSAKTRK